MTSTAIRLVVLCVAPLLLVSAPKAGVTTLQQDPAPNGTVQKTMNIHYLEIVTPEVDATCEALSKMHGVTFGEHGGQEGAEGRGSPALPGTNERP